MKRWLMAAFLPLVVAMLALAGCATQDGEDRGRIAVTYTVLKLVEQSDEIDGDRVLAAVETVRSAVDTTTVTTAGDLADTVVGVLNFDVLSPADQFLAMEVVRQITAGLTTDIETGVLPEDYAAALETWLGWIEGAAYMAGANR
jgi:hypothetical protein